MVLKGTDLNRLYFVEQSLIGRELKDGVGNIVQTETVGFSTGALFLKVYCSSHQAPGPSLDSLCPCGCGAKHSSVLFAIFFWTPAEP